MLPLRRARAPVDWQASASPFSNDAADQLRRLLPARRKPEDGKEMAMRKYFRGKHGLTSLHVGLTVVAFAAVVGLITLDAGRGKVMPDELAAEQPAAVAEAPSPATAPTARRWRYIVGRARRRRVIRRFPRTRTSILPPPGTRRRLRRSETQRSRENARRRGHPCGQPDARMPRGRASARMRGHRRTARRGDGRLAPVVSGRCRRSRRT